MSSDLIQSRSVVFRKRGRPVGKHRVPLSLNERRALNAAYEKERRFQMKTTIDELATAVGLNNTMTVQDLLAEVITFIHTSTVRDKYRDADSLRKYNDNLESQITMLEHRLATETDPKSLTCPVKRKEDCDWSSPPRKRFSPNPCQDSVQLSSCQRVQPRLVSKLQCHSTLDSTSQLQELWHREEISPAIFTEALIPNVKLSSCSNPAPSPLYCDTVEPSVNNEDLPEMANMCTFDATAGSRISLRHFDIRATEEDLVSLYL